MTGIFHVERVVQKVGKTSKLDFGGQNAEVHNLKAITLKLKLYLGF